MKIFLILALALVARAEPPVPTDYSYDMAPPSVNAPSATYGSPDQQYPGTPLHTTGLTDAKFTGFGAESRMPSQQYGAPSGHSHHSARMPSQQYGAPSARTPSQQYGAPSARTPSQQYGAPSSRSHSARMPSQQYGAPSARTPSQQYGAPSARTPSQQYGAPAARMPSQQYGAPSGFEGYPDARNAFDDDMSEPASYEYKYEVNDGDSGSEFGHKEERDGAATHGEYRVLLPDGRTQVVTYEADENGYRPQITYIEAENQGYPRGANNQQGYPRGGNGGGPY